MTLTAKVTLDGEQAMKALAGMGTRGPRALEVGVRSALLMLVRHVTKNKLLGQVLKRRTGTLIRSITASPRVETSTERVTGIFGTHLEYGKAHEVGFSGSVTVRQHIRRVRSRDVRGRLEGLTKSGRARRGIIGRGFAVVRAHDRRMDIRARHYHRDTLTERQGEVRLRLLRALRIAYMTGRTPKLSEVGGA